jgi:predicted ATPase
VSNLPTGTVTFLFTDVEGSTSLLRELGAEAYATALAEHRRVVRAACARHDGVEVDTQGDAFFVAFPTGAGGVAAADEIVASLAGGPIRVRAGLHTGAPLVRDGGYVGQDVHLAARIAAAGHGGQVLVSASTAALTRVPLRELGEHRLKDIDEAVVLFQLGEEPFPPLRTIANTNLPRPASTFVGRERELAEARARLAGGARLLTLTGPGGSGKTRLAIEAVASLVPDYSSGIFWVGLTALRDPTLVVDTIAQALGAKNGLTEQIGERELLLLLDNFEQVIDAAPELTSLLAACRNLTLVVTSRELLRIQGEIELRVPPLADREAVDLFCERAQAEPSAEIAELCRRLDSLPLAVELAAARTKAFSPAQILERLSERLDLLQGGRDAEPRQQTLRATIEWSLDLLSEGERALLARLSVFAGGCTLSAAEDVARAEPEALQSLVEKSLLRFSNERYWLLETIRELAAEQLDASEADALRHRHRAYYTALAESYMQQLHTAEEGAASARLAPDYPNVRAAVADGFAAGEPEDVGLILGSLYPFLISHGHLGEVGGWVETALAARERLSSRALAETLAAGGEIARFAGDLERAIELKEELTAVSTGPQRPNWKAATLADLCEIALDQGDFGRARDYAEQAAEAGAGARAELGFAELALRTGDLETAAARAAAALAGFEEGSFNHACSLELLGEIARREGSEPLAYRRFGDALRSFAAIGDGGGMADCFDGLARLAAGDERAGLLAGVAVRLRAERGRRPIRADVPLPEEAGAGRVLELERAVEVAVELAASRSSS